MIYTIKNEHLSLSVEKFGAQMKSIKSGNIEYLWQGDPKYWTGRAINLFPYCARLTDNTYIIDGNKYHMNIHGLAMYNDFDLFEQGNDYLIFQFKYNENTLKSYPRKFIYQIIYKLIKNKIEITFKVMNEDEKPMYFGLGGHPGFNVPLVKENNFEDYYLKFDAKELTQIVFSDDCYVTDKTNKIELKNGKMNLKHSLFDNDAIVIKNAPKKVEIKTDKDEHKIVVCYPHISNLGIWHMPHTDAPYVCIEPWLSLPSRKGVIEEFEKQSDLIKLDHDNIYMNTWSIEIY